MKKQSIVYLLMFVFAFVLPSFSFPDKDDGKGSVEKTMQTTSDSVTVNVKFNNPSVTITQHSLEKKLESQALSNKELIDVVKGFGDNFTKLNELQERRYESAMTQLERRTGYSVGQINKFIKQKNELYVIIGIMLLVHLILLVTLYNTSYRRLRESVEGLLAVILSSAAILTLTLMLLWPTFMGHNYQMFNELLKLPSI